MVDWTKKRLGSHSFAVQGMEALSTKELQPRGYLCLESEELEIYLR